MENVDKYRDKVKSLGKSKHTLLNLRLQKTYGITFKEYKVMYLAQDGCCSICATKFDLDYVLRDGPAAEFAAIPLVVDHCHESGNVRALLCSSCNSGLGFFKDNQTSLAKAIEYLIRHKETHSAPA
jgi:hypothetical protein